MRTDKYIKKRIRKELFGIMAALLVMAAAAVPMGDSREKGAAEGSSIELAEDSAAEIHFIDVGQGDATLIKCGGEVMLIDTGENDKGTAIQLYLQKQGVEKLEYLVLTHPDSDHIGGADVVITKFEIGQVFMPDYEKENRTYEDVVQALKDKRIEAVVPQVGAVYPLGGGAFTILAPNRTYSDSNNSSIALLFQNGENRFLFTGDAEEEAEKDILETGLSLQADVYKAGHHGSSTASTKEFLEAVDAEYAVISCGEDNSYGHPHAEVLNNLRGEGVKVFRTDEQGSIVAWSDGKEITWNCAPSDSWKSGEKRK